MIKSLLFFALVFLWVPSSRCQSTKNIEPSPARQDGESSPALAKDLEAEKKRISEAESEKRKILGSLYAINRRMKKITQEKSHLTDELISVQGNARNTAQTIAKLEAILTEQKHALHRRLRAMYKLSGQDYMSILLSQSSPSDLDRVLRGLRAISDRDHRLILTYQENIESYRKHRSILKQQAQKLVNLEKRIKQQEGQLLAEHIAKSAFVSGLEISKAQSLAHVQALRQTAGANSNSIEASFFENKGQLPPPLASAPSAIGDGVQLKRGFGAINDESTHAELSHRGWQIAAPLGTAVQAVFPGNVIHIGWVNGFGKVIILDHGDHYYTLYGFTENLHVKIGEHVDQGRNIAEVGPSSWRDGIGLYFEIRHFSEPEDPSHWINPSNHSKGIGGSGLAHSLE